jgi:hypothetical protein
VFLRAVSADQRGFSRAVISRRHPKLVESLIASKLLLTALFSFLSRRIPPRSFLIRQSVKQTGFWKTFPLIRIEPFSIADDQDRLSIRFGSMKAGRRNNVSDHFG